MKFVWVIYAVQFYFFRLILSVHNRIIKVHSWTSFIFNIAIFPLFFRRRQRFIANMWNSFWWWRDQFNSEVQLKDRIGWEGNIKHSPLNCQWRSVSLKCMACDSVWLSGHVLWFVGWILRVHPIDAHFWKKYKEIAIIHLNNYNNIFHGKTCLQDGQFSMSG